MNKRYLVSILVSLVLLAIVVLPINAAREWLSSEEIGTSGSVDIRGYVVTGNATGSETALSIQYWDGSAATMKYYNLPASDFILKTGETVDQMEVRLANQIQDNFSIICELKWFHPSDPVRDKDWTGDGIRDFKWQDPNTGTIYIKGVTNFIKMQIYSQSPLNLVLSHSLDPIP